ncbi:MAG TPA: hypothetical protein DCQ06_04400, partial [Myxococcales bacterium]|nr:hypothetical protein [Myxococcales bacterium]
PSAGLDPTLDQDTVHHSLDDMELAQAVQMLDYLEPWESEALANLTLFAASMPTAAALEVTATVQHPQAPWPVDLLERLIRLNLLCHVPGAHASRLSLNPSVYDALDERFAPTQLARQRHASWYAEFASEFPASRFDEVDAKKLLWVVQQEQSNLAVAINNGTSAQALECGLLMLRVHLVYGPASAVEPLAEDLISRVPCTLLELWQFVVITCEAAAGQATFDKVLPLMHEMFAAVLEQQNGLQHRALRPWPHLDGAAAGDTAVTMAKLVKLAGKLVRVLRASNQPKAERLLAESTVVLARYGCNRVEMQATEQVLDLGYLVAERNNLSDICGYLLSLRGKYEHMNGNLQSAAQAHRSAVQLHDTNGNSNGAQRARYRLGLLLNSMGELEQAKTNLRESLKLAQRMARPDLTAYSMFGVAFCSFYEGAYDTATRQFREVAERFVQIGNPNGYFVALYNATCSLVDAEHYDDALQVAESITNTEMQTRYPGLYAASLTLRTWLRVLLDRPDNVDAHLQSSGPFLKSVPDQYCLYLCRRGEVNLMRSRRKDALIDLATLKALLAEHQLQERRTLQVVER